jgi:hypothetical protein
MLPTACRLNIRKVQSDSPRTNIWSNQLRPSRRCLLPALRLLRLAEESIFQPTDAPQPILNEKVVDVFNKTLSDNKHIHDYTSRQQATVTFKIVQKIRLDLWDMSDTVDVSSPRFR